MSTASVSRQSDRHGSQGASPCGPPPVTLSTSGYRMALGQAPGHPLVQSPSGSLVELSIHLLAQ